MQPKPRGRNRTSPSELHDEQLSVGFLQQRHNLIGHYKLRSTERRHHTHPLNNERVFAQRDHWYALSLA